MTSQQISYSIWKNFVENGVADQFLPQVVVDSWKRCQQLSLDPFNRNLVRISDLQSMMEMNRTLIGSSLRMINQLQGLIYGSGIAFVLVDADGNILDVTGDAEIIEMGKTNSMVPGANRSEEKAGTNAIGVALKINEPVQITGCQHFNFHHHKWTCSAAPIHNSKGEIIGAINISELCSLAHKHTLGMVTAAAKVIEREINLKDAELTIKLVNEWLNGISDIVDDGIVFVNNLGTIIEANHACANLLGKRLDEIRSANLSNLLNYQGNLIDQLQNKSQVERQIDYPVKGGFNKELTVKLKSLKDDKADIIGTVVLIHETSKVQQRGLPTNKLSAWVTFKDIIGNNLCLRKAIEIAQTASLTHCKILLQGETGTGKELFAQAIHNASPVKDGPFIAVNCGAIPHELIESELFGYDDGAFTGAKRGGKPGKFELGQGGTILLDEINSMPIDMQVKLLRVVQENRLMRVGGTDYVSLNVRIIASSNESLEELIDNKTFRRDLYYRLSIVTIDIPPLRERSEDLPILIEHFLKKLAKIHNKVIKGIKEDALQALTVYHWPGNARELENFIERAIILTGQDIITLQDLPQCISEAVLHKNNQLELRNPQRLVCESMSISTLDDLEKEAIINILHSTGYNILKTAKMLGITRNTLYRKIREYGIHAVK